MAKIKIDANLYHRAKEAAVKSGYSSLEEYVTHLLEKELSKINPEDVDEKVTDQLRGLGYIE
jgi:hypothetical protein